MTNGESNSNSVLKKPFDLEERTAKFGEAMVAFCRKIPATPVVIPLVSQGVRAGTSIGANYCEANDAESRNDFTHKIGICRKESRETMYWLRIIASTLPELKEEARTLWKEAHELNLIFAKIVRSSRAHSTKSLEH